MRALVLAGHSVQVVATEAALRFVGRPTLEAISRNPVHTDLYEGVAEVRHVAIGQRAELIVVAPATANTIAKLAAGLADDLLGTTILASMAPVVLAPAMHTEMWQNPATQANVALLTARGIHFVGPAVGQLTGNDSGPGRMAEPVDIVDFALSVAAAPAAAATPASVSAHRVAVPGDLAGRHILITAGGTREPLDPVRFIGNRSSGKQGIALALAAVARGAAVMVVGANLEVAAPENIAVRHVSTTRELSDVTRALASSADVIIMAAAVADFRPESVAASKIKKELQGDVLQLTLVRNPDILADLVADRAARDGQGRSGQVIIGFAAETETDREALLELGRAKVRRKGSDFLVLNTVGWTEVFNTESTAVILLDDAGAIVGEASGTKTSVADRILDLLS